MQVTTKAWWAGIAITLALSGCDKATTSPQPAASGSAPAASVPASAAASSSAAPAASAQAVSPANAKGFSGEYTAKKATVEPPEKVKDVTWKRDTGEKMIGPGKLSFQVAEGLVKGEASGAFGDQLVSGTFDGKELKFTLLPKDAKQADAMTGTGVGEVGASGITGTLRCSGNDGVVVREATFELKGK